MSISSTVRKAGPFAGSGTVSTFTFPFKVFEDSDLLVVVLAVATGVESTLVLDSDYSVALNPNQDSNPGGTITLMDGPLPTGFNLVISSAVPELQGVELTNQGGFYPEVVTDEFDLLTILIQQLEEQLSRTIEFPITDPSGINTQLPPVAQRAGMYLTFDASGNPVTVVAAPGQTSPQTLSFGYLEATSASGQTVFTTPPYTPGSNNLIVTTGGLTLAVGVDYTETTTTSITLTAPSPDEVIYTFRSILASGFTPGVNVPNVLVVPYAASVTLNAGLANGFYLAGMTGNLTIAGVWGLAPGQRIAMFYQQDATGGRTVTFPSIMVGAAQPDPTPNAVSVQIFEFDAVTGLLRASGPLFSANGAFFAEGINTTGAVAAASGAFSGGVAAASVAATGAITAATASVGSIAAATAAVSGLLTAGSLNVGAGTFTASLVAPTVAPADSSTNVATTAWAKYGLSMSLGTNGYIKLPAWLGGLVLQWGMEASTNNTFDFPTPFPTACFVFVAGNINSQGSAVDNAFGYAVSLSTFFLATKSSTGGGTDNFPCSWIAIGN